MGFAVATSRKLSRVVFPIAICFDEKVGRVAASSPVDAR